MTQGKRTEFFILLAALFFFSIANPGYSCEIVLDKIGVSNSALLLETGQKIKFLLIKDIGTKEMELDGEKVLWIVKGKEQPPWVLVIFTKADKRYQGWVDQKESASLKKLNLVCP
jgi:hypothetical protein